MTACSSLTTMFQTSNTICQNVYLTDDFKIGLEYDNHRGLLNILLKNTDNNNKLPSHINILSNQDQEYELRLKNHNEYFLSSTRLQQDLENEITNISYREEDEPKICIELSNIYVYDLYDENENDLCQTMITSPPLLFSSSLSSSSSCFDEPTIDNDDGYSTHSLDDIEQSHQQQQSISMLPSKEIIPFKSYQFSYYIEPYVSSIRRQVEQLIWLSPFKKTVKQMMNNHLFD
ncbi:unnamed protein product [Rotaria sp. Silwood1]|nr:unnamed protein product [Rotaria sp. Silwood1]CAF3597431.1 unnamed protein product [Rotaria sp. Silwood1]CAF3605076.1 unnamed protein product [Rotaria sp. Silwood1]CAF3641470.1 unnamed protein product [Rotaria sp. Silwood1]CAF4697812.1 unnamed protein product [Rotaria sp. Silwood1]